MNGWDKHIVDSDNSRQSDKMTTSLLPTEEWLDNRLPYSSTQHMLPFTNAQIISYFVMRTGDKGLPWTKNDSKTVNSIVRY